MWEFELMCFFIMAAGYGVMVAGICYGAKLERESHNGKDTTCQKQNESNPSI